MASDLIYREDAKVFVRHACYKKINPIEYLDEVPAADVRPVVRGRWEPGETVFFCGVEYAAQRTCSVCGRSALDEPWYFCPNCGAEMITGKEENGRT